MESMMNSKKEFDDSLILTKKASLISGIELGESKRTSIWIKSIFFINLIWLHTDVLGEFYWLIEGIKMGKSLDELSMVAPCTTICLLATAKTIPIYLNLNVLKSAVEKLRSIHPDTNDEEEEKNNVVKKIVKESIKFLNSVILFLYSCSLVVVVMFSCLPLMMMAYEYYKTGGTELKLPFLIKYFFDPYANTVLWGFVYFHQVWSTALVCLNIFCSDTLFYAFCMYLRMHFRILGHHFEHVVSDDQDETRDKLRKCVMRHQELIELVNQMEIVYSKSTLFHILTSSLLICLSGFNITFIQDMSAVLAFISFLVVSLAQISLMCFFGDLLMTSSMEVSQAIYKCQWYDADPDIKRSVFLILFRAQKPCKLTAANFADLNLSAFTTILSRSWSYFALLRTMYD